MSDLALSLNGSVFPVGAADNIVLALNNLMSMSQNIYAAGGLAL